MKKYEDMTVKEKMMYIAKKHGIKNPIVDYDTNKDKPKGEINKDEIRRLAKEIRSSLVYYDD